MYHGMDAMEAREMGGSLVSGCVWQLDAKTELLVAVDKGLLNIMLCLCQRFNLLITDVFDKRGLI